LTTSPIAKSIMASALSTTISCCIIGLLFIVPGIVKTVYINQRITKDMLKLYKNFTDVFPLAPLGFQPTQKHYMETVGVSEIILGTMLSFGTTPARRAAIVLLMLLTCLSVYTHIMLKDYRGCMVPAGYMGLLLWLLVGLGKHFGASSASNNDINNSGSSPASDSDGSTAQRNESRKEKKAQ
ncbi:hypothetical protein BOX15_Mlig013260g1, partial [Macrostomum lignano]